MLPFINPHHTKITHSDKSEANERGATYLEYIASVLLLGFVFVGVVSLWGQMGLTFYSQVTDEMIVPYPINYISPP